MTQLNLEQDLMQKIATILHDDDQRHLPSTMILADGLGAHVPEVDKIASYKHQPNPAPIAEPKIALAGMGVAQIMHQPAFQAGVEARMAERSGELIDACTKLAGMVDPVLRAAQKVAKKAGFRIASPDTMNKAMQMNAKGIRGTIRRNPLKTLGGGMLAAGGGVAAFSNGRKEAGARNPMTAKKSITTFIERAKGMRGYIQEHPGKAAAGLFTGGAVAGEAAGIAQGRRRERNEA